MREGCVSDWPPFVGAVKVDPVVFVADNGDWRRRRSLLPLGLGQHHRAEGCDYDDHLTTERIRVAGNFHTESPQKHLRHCSDSYLQTWTCCLEMCCLQMHWWMECPRSLASPLFIRRLPSTARDYNAHERKDEKSQEKRTRGSAPSTCVMSLGSIPESKSLPWSSLGSKGAIQNRYVCTINRLPNRMRIVVSWLSKLQAK